MSALVASGCRTDEGLKNKDVNVTRAATPPEDNRQMTARLRSGPQKSSAKPPSRHHEPLRILVPVRTLDLAVEASDSSKVADLVAFDSDNRTPLLHLVSPW